MVSKPLPRLTGPQLRAARALLGISAGELAEETKIGLRTIGRAEKQNGSVGLTEANERSLINALQARGVVFLFDDQEGPGVRLRRDARLL